MRETKSNLHVVTRHKNAIINLLLNNQDFITVMAPPRPPCSQITAQDMLLGGSWLVDGTKYEEQGQLFDYNFFDDTIEAEKTFVFVETDIHRIRQSLFTDFSLYIYAFTAKSLVRLTDTSVPSVSDMNELGYHAGDCKNRIDLLCDIIDQTVNANPAIKGIGYMEPSPEDFCTIYSPDSRYHGKCLKYKISNLNEVEDYYDI